MIRIISGLHKGRRLRAPKNLPVRPTTDRVKEALFNILGGRIDWSGSRVLDLFAGTGNISYECASRGCPAIIAVDAHPACVAFIRKTAADLEMPIEAIRQQAIRYLRRPTPGFDLIFADPPYDYSFEVLKELVDLSLQENHLLEEGLFVLEHSRGVDFEGVEGFTEARTYGSSVLSFFEKEKSRP